MRRDSVGGGGGGGGGGGIIGGGGGIVGGGGGGGGSGSWVTFFKDSSTFHCRFCLSNFDNFDISKKDSIIYIASETNTWGLLNRVM